MGAARYSPPPEPFAQIAEAIQSAEADFTSTHPMDTDGRFWVDAIAAWADVLIGAATSLLEQPHLDWLRTHPMGGSSPLLSERIRSPDLFPLHELLQIRLARSALRRIKTGESRLSELLDYLVDVSLSERSRDYLTRVASLYLWGFDAESIALARSVLEVALEAKLPDDAVRSLVTVKGREPTLSDRIAAAYNAKALDDDTRRAAHDLRVAGNEVLHTAPGAYTTVTSSVDALQKLRAVLRRLDSGATAA